MHIDPAAYDARTTIGLAALSRHAYQGGDLTPLWEALVKRASSDPNDAAALMDLSVILHMTGQRENGLAIQAQALGIRRHYRRPNGRGEGLRVLAMVVAGDFMANTPIDFLLEGSDVQLELLYVDEGGPTEVPEHDVLFLAIGESAENQPVLRALAPVLGRWPRPVVNADALRIAALTRDGVHAMFAGSRRVLSPVNVMLPRSVLAEAAAGAKTVPELIPEAQFPIIVRPLGSHAGHGLEKLDDASALAAYLAAHEDAAFYASPFVDYRSPDGLYRKQRIAFIGGVAYVSHLAVSERWMVHYLNAGMGESQAKRDEEAAFMAGFREGFAQRHAAAFAELQQKIGLDYFAIDCAEAPDGRLLLFEADVAMIVHAMDSETLYPYKQPAMRELFAAFVRLLQDRAAATAAAVA